MPENVDHITPEPLPFDEAIVFWQDKVVLAPGEFYTLADEMRAKAFTVSGISKADLLTDVYEAVGKAIEKGTTLAEFKDDIGHIIDAKGWTGKRNWRVDNIFRTNVQTAYNTGRYKQMRAKKDRFPYWEYDAVNDSRTRPTHLALDGKIFAVDDPFWDTWYPPNGFRCRCGVNPVHKAFAEAEDLKIEQDDPTGKLFEPIDPETGTRLPARPLMPDPGWDHNPAKVAWEPDISKYPRPLEDQLKSAGIGTQ